MDHIKLKAARKRAKIISQGISDRLDHIVKAKISSFKGKLSWNIEHHGIDPMAWKYIRQNTKKCQLVFAHPDILVTHPDTSLHYRGIATLSRKLVQQLVGSINKWEEDPEKARVTHEKALNVARLYNTVISSIILDSTEWTLENGYRNILATMGIALDGTLRNIIGQAAEDEIKEKMKCWLENQSQIAFKALGNKKTWILGHEGVVKMVYASEPDIRFERKKDKNLWETISTIEIKGGTDRAGALERLGAIKKSFDRTSAKTKNFLVVGVVTAEMQNQLDKMRIEKTFMLFNLLHDETEWKAFVNEVFHHTLRLLPVSFKK